MVKKLSLGVERHSLYCDTESSLSSSCKALVLGKTEYLMELFSDCSTIKLI